MRRKSSWPHHAPARYGAALEDLIYNFNIADGNHTLNPYLKTHDPGILDQETDKFEAAKVAKEANKNRRKTGKNGSQKEVDVEHQEEEMVVYTDPGCGFCGEYNTEGVVGRYEAGVESGELPESLIEELKHQAATMPTEDADAEGTGRLTPKRSTVVPGREHRKTAVLCL